MQAEGWNTELFKLLEEYQPDPKLIWTGLCGCNDFLADWGGIWKYGGRPESGEMLNERYIAFGFFGLVLLESIYSIDNIWVLYWLLCE